MGLFKREHASKSDEEMTEMRKFRILSIACIALFSTSSLISPAANAAYTVPPRAGQCFQYSVAQVSASYPTKNPISCNSTHNIETYLVAVWPMSTNPQDMTQKDQNRISYELCDFWGRFPNAESSRSSKTRFNAWGWFSPNRAAWAKGERWIRCDAIIGKYQKSDSSFPEEFISWKGSKLQKIYN